MQVILKILKSRLLIKMSTWNIIIEINNVTVFFYHFYIIGITVNYPFDVGNIKAGKVTLRVILLLWTGDYPAQCEIGKFSCKGTFGCRLDKSQGSLLL